ncbi:MAG: hypothetical protein LUD68_01225 [Rikenellaceae bacterium]|nr:hypothetical protein [Rikenellaceae bacterium]
MVKLSPLFDLEEALRVFSGSIARLEIVSVEGEVKELLAELAPGSEYTELRISLSGNKTFTFRPEERFPERQIERPEDFDYSYLLVPDAAFYKGRLAQALLRRYYPESDLFLPAEYGFVYARRLPAEFPGRIYRIAGLDGFHPKRLKKWIKQEEIRRVNLLRRNFFLSSREILQRLGVQEGGDIWLAFTELNGKPVVFRVEPLRTEERSGIAGEGESFHRKIP